MPKKNKISKKSQAVSEFLVLFGVAVIIFVGFLTYVSHDLKDMAAKKEMNAINDIGLSVQKELIIASNAKDGYFRQFRLPDKYNTISYDISINSNYLIVTSKESGFQQEFIIPEINGQPKKGLNNITKANSTIYLNQ